MSAAAACARAPRAPLAPATATRRPAPVVQLPPRVIALSAGGDRTCALFDTGNARCWGRGGGLGRANYVDVGDDETPASASDFDAGGAISAVSVGDSSTCVLLRSGQVRCTETGRGYPSPTVVEVKLGARATQISVGHDHACALLESGAVRCWGSGQLGQLGYGNRHIVRLTDVGQPGRDVNVGGKVLQIATGESITCALLESHAVRCWGMAPIGYKDLGAVGTQHTPAEAGDIELGARAQQIRVGGVHICALLEDQRVRCWGMNNNGELGYGHTDPVGAMSAPASAGDVNVGGKVTQISAGDAHTCALLEGGSVRCWGSAGQGRLGYGKPVAIGDDEAPASAGDVPIGGRVVQVVTGGAHTCALLEAGSVRCWGRGDHGQLGYGNPDNLGSAETPAAVGDVPLFDPKVRVSLPAQRAAQLAADRKVREDEAAAERAAHAAALAAAPTNNELGTTGHTPTPKECEAECSNCSLLWDSQHPPRSHKRVLTAAERRIVTQAFVAHLTSGECATNSEALPVAAIGGKADYSEVLSVTDGSFSAPHRHQTLIAFVAGDCGRQGFPGDNWGAHLTLLLENDTLLATFKDDNDAPLVLRTVRVIPGEVDQVLIEMLATGAGGSVADIALRSYADAQQRNLAEFETSSEGCSFGETKRAESITRYRWNPSTADLCFVQQHLDMPCP